MSETTEAHPCKDSEVELRDIFHRCSATIDVFLEDGRGALSLSDTVGEDEKVVSSQLHFCIWVERGDGKYASVTRLGIPYPSAQQIKTYIENMPKPIYKR